MKRLVLTLCIIGIAAGTIHAQSSPAITKTGTTAAQFLKIGVGARSIGMGGAFTGVSDDITAIYWNPAGLAQMTSGQAEFNHVNWIADIKYDVAAASIIVDGLGTLGATFATLNDGEMEVTTTSEPEGTGEKFTAGGTMIGLSYARSLTDRFSIGFNFKYLNEYIWHETAQSFAIDFGTMFVAPVLNGLKIGASMSNFGPKMQLDGRDILFLVNSGAGNQNLVDANYTLDSYELPLLFRVGLATDALKEENSRLTLAVDAVHPNDNTEYVNSGVEYSWSEMVAVRAGWKSAFERGGEQGLTLGAGLNYTLQGTLGFVFDYAYQDFGRLQSVQYFSVGVKF
jgi:hypothetical protein